MTSRKQTNQLQSSRKHWIWKSQFQEVRSQESKNVAGQVQKYNLNNWMEENLEGLYLTSRSDWTMPDKTQTKSSRNIEKLKQSNKLNKNILIAKTLDAFTIGKIPLNLFISKKCSRPIFVSEIVPVVYLHDLKKLIGPWRLINSKMTGKF